MSESTVSWENWISSTAFADSVLWACLMVVGMDEDLYFDHVLSILVYPTGYMAPGAHASGTGFVLESGQPEAHDVLRDYYGLDPDEWTGSPVVD